jgi:pimeloyl-ACP methyl ester carboxylesterase
VVERLKENKVPTMLVLGAESPAFFKTAIDPVLGTLQNNRLVVLPGQQHIAIDTAPDLFAREVVAFLSEPS